jgi:mRNA interferase MazF
VQLGCDLRRGDIVRAVFGGTIGSEQAGELPAVVLSPTFINERSPIVVIAPITSKKTDRVYPYEVLIDPPEAGLTLPSKALLLRARSVDIQRLGAKLGELSVETMCKIDIALKIAMGLDLD